MASKTQPTKLTGADILAILNRNTTNDDSSFSDTVVDYAADRISSTVVGISRISAAAVQGGTNAAKHFALERAVQKARAEHKLVTAANRAAERMNSYIGA